MRFQLFLIACCMVAAAEAQPLFQVPKPTCQSVPIDVIIPNIFATYHWDFGNGTTADTYAPPIVQYATPGNYTISLTVTSATPFRVIDSVIVTQIHPNSWVGGGFCLGEGSPDLFLEYLSYTANSPYWVRTPVQDEVLPPVFYGLSGLITHQQFPLTVWDKDDGFWCGASDFLGQINVPANTTGGQFSDTGNQLKLLIKTKMVTSTTFSQSFPVNETPAPPTITCANDSLYSSYSSSNVWLASNQTTILGFGQSYHPTASGTYYVKYNDANCPSISDAFHYMPGCSAVATEEIAGESSLLIFPNPTSGLFEIALPVAGKNRTWTCRISDIQGKVIDQITPVPTENGTLQMNVSLLPSGVYFLQVSDGEMTYWEKVIRA